MSTGSACVPAPLRSSQNFVWTQFPVFPCYEGISKGADLGHELNSPECRDSIATRRTTKGGPGNLRAGVSCGVRSPSRLPFAPRHATGNRTPVISCYAFGNAAVCLEIRGDNRRIFFCAFAARRTHTVERKCALLPVGDAVRKRSAFRRGPWPNPGTSAGRKSPVLKSQVIDSTQYFALQNFRANEPHMAVFFRRPEGGFHGSNTGRRTGRESPVPRSQVVESAASFGTKNYAKCLCRGERQTWELGGANSLSPLT
jgi:hypothetical protein